MNRRADDRGSVLLVALVTLVVLSTVVIGIASFAGTIFRSQSRTDPRLASSGAVDSAMRMAITMARDNGPTSCFTTSQVLRINDVDVTVTCTTEATYSTGTRRYGVITTGNSSSVAPLAGRGSGFTKDIDGNVFVNAGNLRSANSDILVRNAEITYSRWTSSRTPLNRYVMGNGSAVACTNPATATNDQYAAGTSSLNGNSYRHSHDCVDVPWWQRTGDNITGTGWVYPTLPPLPAYARSGYSATVGSCRVYYPGRYTGSNRLTLDGGTHYFASGVYYFERDLEIRNGARVVMGDGRFAGCSYDAEAAVLSTAPRAHEITGRGATLLLGGGADLTVTNSSLRINRRVSTVNTQGSEGIAIRTVNTATSSNAVEIPEDTVTLTDGTVQRLSQHTIQLRATSPVLRYTPSTLNTSANAVTVTLNGSSAASNAFVAEGYVFTPNARVRVTSTVRSYRLAMNGGIVASSVLLDTSQAPLVSTDWAVGSVNSVIQRKMTLTASAVERGVTRSATAVIEVHQDRSLAVNSWTRAA